MFNPTREEVRRFFHDTWRKYGEKNPMSGLEAMAIDIILAHPEYRIVLEEPDLADGMESNPFLHMSLHLAVSEQLSINQPFGIVKRYEGLLEKTGSRHDALHVLMACLEKMLGHAQQYHTPPDQEHYFECLQRHLS